MRPSELLHKAYPLKPCPFCGAPARWTWFVKKRRSYLMISCSKCWVQTDDFDTLRGDEDSEDEIAKKLAKDWNTRRIGLNE